MGHRWGVLIEPLPLFTACPSVAPSPFPSLLPPPPLVSIFPVLLCLPNIWEPPTVAPSSSHCLSNLVYEHLREILLPSGNLPCASCHAWAGTECLGVAHALLAQDCADSGTAGQTFASHPTSPSPQALPHQPQQLRALLPAQSLKLWFHVWEAAGKTHPQADAQRMCSASF